MNEPANRIPALFGSCVFNEERMELKGEMSGKTYKLGQKIQVMVTGTDRLTKTIDFIPAKNLELPEE